MLVHRAQGRKVRQFISSYGQETLRLYKKQNNLLQELISRLQDIKDILQKEKNRKEHFYDKSTKKSIQATINFLQKQLDKILQEINNLIHNDKQLKAKAQVISSVKSVGHTTTMTLLAALLIPDKFLL